MSKYFDQTFFKFLFGFIAILAASFAFLYFTRLLDTNREPTLNTYAEVEVVGAN